MNGLDRWEAVREAAGIAPTKWALMTRDERRQVERALGRAPRDRQIRQPGRHR